MEKIITVHEKSYKIVKSDGSCQGCASQFNDHVSFCDELRAENMGSCEYVTFQEVKDEPKTTAKPTPTGITPLRVHNSIRLQALLSALQRYSEAQKPVLPEWITEVKDLVEYERSLTREALEKVPFKL